MTKLLQSCGDCMHSRAFPQDMKLRVCRGAPPTVVLMPVQGGLQAQSHYPVVDATNEGCGAYKRKSQFAIDNLEGNA